MGHDAAAAHAAGQASWACEEQVGHLGCHYGELLAAICVLTCSHRSKPWMEACCNGRVLKKVLSDVSSGCPQLLLHQVASRSRSMGLVDLALERLLDSSP